jgi:hypothetical protein
LPRDLSGGQGAMNSLLLQEFKKISVVNPAEYRKIEERLLKKLYLRATHNAF